MGPLILFDHSTNKPLMNFKEDDSVNFNNTTIKRTLEQGIPVPEILRSECQGKSFVRPIAEERHLFKKVFVESYFQDVYARRKLANPPNKDRYELLTPEQYARIRAALHG